MAEDVDYCKLFRSWLTGEEHALPPSSESRNKKWQKEARLPNLWSLHAAQSCVQSASPVTFHSMITGTRCQCDIGTGSPNYVNYSEQCWVAAWKKNPKNAWNLNSLQDLHTSLFLQKHLHQCVVYNQVINNEAWQNFTPPPFWILDSC